MRKIIAFLIAAVLIFFQCHPLHLPDTMNTPAVQITTLIPDHWIGLVLLGATRETNAQVVQLKETVLTPLRINQRS